MREDVAVSGGHAFMRSGPQGNQGGRWAGEQFLKALKEGRPIGPAELRTNDTLQRDEWIAFDNAIVEEAQIRLRVVSALIGAGLSSTIPNGMAKTLFMYDKMTDMGPAVVSLDGMSKSENDTVEFEEDGVPLPITHKDYYINIRRLSASRLRGESLDTSMARAAGRKIGEETERMLLQGGKKFGAYTIYGLTNHPSRETASFGTNGSWNQTAKTGENIIADIGTLMAAAEANRMYGPWWIIAAGNMSTKFAEDFKANSDRTIRERIMAIDGIQNLIVADQMPASQVVMVQATRDVVEMKIGEPLQNIQWDIEGGMQVNFKAMTIMVPVIKTDTEDRSGIVHMS